MFSSCIPAVHRHPRLPVCVHWSLQVCPSIGGAERTCFWEYLYALFCLGFWMDLSVYVRTAFIWLSNWGPVILRLNIKDMEIISCFGASILLIANNWNAMIIGYFSFLWKKNQEMCSSHPHLQGTQVLAQHRAIKQWAGSIWASQGTPSDVRSDTKWDWNKWRVLRERAGHREGKGALWWQAFLSGAQT